MVSADDDEPLDPWVRELHRQVGAGELDAEWAIAQITLVYGPRWATPLPIEDQDPKYSDPDWLLASQFHKSGSDRQQALLARRDQGRGPGHQEAGIGSDS